MSHQNPSHRIEVDHCRDCPFVRDDVDEAGAPYDVCVHPAKGAVCFDDYGLAPDVPPSWCPLRATLTLIAGPRSNEP